MDNGGGASGTPKLELTLNLSPPRPSGGLGTVLESPATRAKANSFGHPSNLIMQEPTVKSMVLVGCPRCLMYVMLSGANPKCPRCKSTVLLAFLNSDPHGAKEHV